MLFLPKASKFTSPLLFGLALLLAAFIFPVTQSSGDPGIQGDVFTGATITTTAQTAVVACGQGAGAVGRKTLVVENQTGGGIVTATGELRTSSAAPSFTSGYLAVNAVAAGAAGGDTALPTEAAGRFCRISVTSASTSVVTVTLRRE